MLCVIPYFSGDKDQAVRLADWIRTLGGVKNHDCLLVIDSSTSSDGVIEPLREAFRSVEKIVSEPAGSQGSWGNGTTDATAANQMWMTANVYIFHKLRVPFFWLEPDAVPIRSTWLDEIESAYRSCGKKFMGMYVDMPPHEPHMSGVACYPFDVANNSLAMMTPGPIAWDYAGRRDTVVKQKAHFTKLIQHVYRVHGETPTFPNPDSLSEILPETAVYHRCKDSSLVDRLREKFNTSPSSQQGESVHSTEAHNLGSVGSTPTPATLSEQSAIAFLTERAARSGIDKGRVVKLLRGASIFTGEKPMDTPVHRRTMKRKRKAVPV